MEFLIKPYKGLTTDEAVVAQCEAQLAGVLDIYEAWLSGSKYLGGDEILLADLHHVPIIDKLMQTSRRCSGARPAVATWATGLLAAPLGRRSPLD